MTLHSSLHPPKKSEKLAHSDQDKKIISAIRRRLERWELDHLRLLATELQDRLDKAEERASRATDDAETAWRSAEFWQQNAMKLQEALLAQDLNIGLTKEGRMVVVEGVIG